ncbi:hypothetical protein AVEN_129822-1, partial [Araneus ventricosus]
LADSQKGRHDTIAQAIPSVFGRQNDGREDLNDSIIAPNLTIIAIHHSHA